MVNSSTNKEFTFPSTKTEEKTFYKKNNGLTSPHRERSRVRKRQIKLLLPSSGSSSAFFSGFPICRSKIGIETFLSFFGSAAATLSFDSNFGSSGFTSLSVFIKHIYMIELLKIELTSGSLISCSSSSSKPSLSFSGK